MRLDDEGGERRRPDDTVWHLVVGIDTLRSPDLLEESSRPCGLVPRPLISLVGFVGSEHRGPLSHPGRPTDRRPGAQATEGPGPGAGVPTD
jgi:hypothetical protein